MKTDRNSIVIKGGQKNRLFKIRLTLAIVAGKLLTSLSRIGGRGGTTLPGRIALKINPPIITDLAKQLPKGNLIVTGTNGKTTTSALLTGILKESGYSCLHNQSGSNMAWGVSSAYIHEARWNGEISHDCAILEVDEGSFPGVVNSVQPDVVVLTNIFRDQLDRYGEVDSIKKAIQNGLDHQPEGGFVILNADDPTLVTLDPAPGCRAITYGLEVDLPGGSSGDPGRDVKTCPQCLQQLEYDKVFYAHLGHYHCPSCKFKRPQPMIRLIGVNYERGDKPFLTISHSQGEIEFPSPLEGWYNFYNILASVSCAIAMNIDPEIIASSLGKAVPSFGRMETFRCGEIKIVTALIKNPVGANEVLRTILARNEELTLLVAINDKIADGTDVSWLWDVDFEQLPSSGKCFSALITSGLRAWDMGVRLKYAGFETSDFVVEENPKKALYSALKATRPGGTLFIMPSYTAMLEIRKILNNMGLGTPYWEVNK